ncbi:hydrogenase large subunit [Serratia sp. JSRIV001]|uniref:hydrogenase large subunit n=1 Tax=Serratia TaxID=613 RepID=UPI0015549454|nr:hydrogenase large subunit [Serratia fonticola]QXN62156.1 hydrogenase large subunit [Serratia fonticola]UAN47818.1 hydrogenase large subunit [Serratia sp. JSRIV001]UAN59675.1 hydrogenase large subunit [Serratia sp. JSRIV004]
MGRSESFLCGRTSGRRSKVSYETHVLTLNNDEKLGKGYLAKVREKFPSALLDAEWQTANQVTITVKLNSLPEIVEYLYYQLGGWLPVLFGNDERTLTGDFAVYYVLSMEEGEKCFITVKAQVSAITLEFPSVTPRVPAAVWGEREIRDMYGLIPVGLPDERRLVLPDDWPDDLYPLRKDTMDYRQRPEPTTDVETYPFENAATGESRVVPIGPMHITSDEPGHFRLFVDGERIVDADYRLFYVHRGMEKLAETRMGYQEVTFLSDRVCGICGFTHSVAYTTSVENALGIYVPPRAHAIRSILLEVERLHSHLLNIGLSSHFVGFDTGFMQFFRVREKSMTMAELLTGSRKTYGLNLIGGVRRDILKEQRVKTIKLIHEMRADVTQLVEMLLATPNIEQRTKGIGLLDRQIARDYSPVGPMIRASGFKRDMRFDHPYANYGSLPKTLFTFDGCDVYSRVMVRVQEVLDSLAMIEYGLDNLPGGPLLTEGFRYQPHKFALGYAEAPRGEDIHWSMLGDNQKLFRWRCRAATYANWPVLRYMLRGNTVSDAPLIIGSLDPCYSCTDRVTLIDINKRKAKTVPYKEIERYGIERTHSPCK